MNDNDNNVTNVQNNDIIQNNASQSVNKKKSGCLNIIKYIFIILLCCSIYSRCTSSLGSGSGRSGKSIKYSSYRNVINDFESSLNKPDGDLMCKTMLPTEQYRNVSPQTIERINREWGFTMGLVKEMYKNFRFDFSINNKSKLSSDDIFSIQNYYSYHFEGTCPVIEEGYTLEIQFKSYDGEKDKVYLNVIRFENDGWRVEEQSAGSAFAVPSPVAQTGGGGFDE